MCVLISSLSIFRAHLQLILSNLLEDSPSSFTILRDWLELPPLDPVTFEALSTPPACLPLKPGVILRPSLLTETLTESYPYRVCLAAETVDNHHIGLLSARVGAAMQLLLPKSVQNVDKEGEGDEISDRLFSNWSKEDNKQSLEGNWIQGRQFEPITEKR